MGLLINNLFTVWSQLQFVASNPGIVPKPSVLFIENHRAVQPCNNFSQIIWVPAGRENQLRKFLRKKQIPETKNPVANKNLQEKMLRKYSTSSSMHLKMNIQDYKCG